MPAAFRAWSRWWAASTDTEERLDDGGGDQLIGELDRRPRVRRPGDPEDYDFVEGGNARRPIPVITFIARQRDPRELVGEEVTGASELGFQDTLNLARGRFDVITLEDRNLPEITPSGC